jgi:hypothetical protein
MTFYTVNTCEKAHHHGKSERATNVAVQICVHEQVCIFFLKRVLCFKEIRRQYYKWLKVV